MPEAKQCKTCDTLLEKRASEYPTAFAIRQYCSRLCRGKARRAAKIKVTCNHCRKVFYRLPSELRRTNHCSKSCMYKWNGVRARLKHSGVTHQCLNCTAEFYVESHRAVSARFCSRVCHYAFARKEKQAQKEYAVCRVCNVRFWRCASWSGPYCSRKCAGVGRRSAGERQCVLCGTTFSLSSRRKNAKYCSWPCSREGWVKDTQSPTTIEIETYAALTELGVEFIPQRRIGKWIVDAYLPSLNIIVECLGDFHHCNPLKNPNGPRHPIQVKTIDRDNRRRAEFKEKGIRLFEMWEADIRQYGARSLLEKALAIAA
jgi:very-short-patch-repair endonuclease